MNVNKQLVRFDWAMKKMFQHEVNYDILEGFLSELLAENITITKVLNHSQKQDDSFNKIDIFAKNSKGDLILIDLTQSQQYDYLHQIRYGASHSTTENIKEYIGHQKIKKSISIIIAYFNLGQEKDYIYHGKTIFKGIHNKNYLDKTHEIYPEYWLIKVDNFNDQIKDKLDEWIYFLKKGQLPNHYTAKGLSEAEIKLAEKQLTPKEQLNYQAYLERLRIITIQQQTKMIDAQTYTNKRIENNGKQRMSEEMEKKEIQAVFRLYSNKIPIKIIANSLNILTERVEAIIATENKPKL